MKNILFTFLWCFLLLSLGTTTLYSQNYGDVNEDGSVNIVDALVVAIYYVGVKPAIFNETNADVDCDLNITIIDALQIAKYYVGIIEMFPCEAEPIILKLGIPFKLKYGQTVQFDGENMLQFTDVVSDSRCPTDVLCVWEGEVAVQLEYSDPEGNTTRFSLSSVNNTEEQVGKYIYVMDYEVFPPRGSSENIIDKNDYVITITITKQIVELGIPFELKYGQTVQFDGENMLQFTDVISDSRCPTDVLCWWEGEVEVQLEYTNPEGIVKRFSLSSLMSTEVQIDNYIFVIDTEVLPPRGTSDTTIYIEDYIITITITKSEPITDRVWISHVSGYQCEPEIFPTQKTARVFLEENGIAVSTMVTETYEVDGACGYPSGIEYHALISYGDLELAIELGWKLSPLQD